MMRNGKCPICQKDSAVALRLSFGRKLQLPTEVEVRHCPHDNFLYSAGGRQADYDEYYATVANDSNHRECSSGAVRSLIAQLQSGHVLAALGDFFQTPRRVLDFGCGEASLLLELALAFPESSFHGFEPGPAALTAPRNAEAVGLRNLTVAALPECIAGGPYDLVIASHVIEHVLDFSLFELLRDLVSPSGMLYVEVPDAQHYAAHQRIEFLYYFDRLHVNHFTPQALARLAAAHGLAATKHFEYSFPYRDGGRYPALGMLFHKVGQALEVTSPNLKEEVDRYIRIEHTRAEILGAELDAFEGVLIWGAGDNFYRSAENGGPLAGLRNMVLLDRRPREIQVGERTCQAVEPHAGIRQYAWPVVVTISEGRAEISRQIAAIDPARRVLFI